MQNLPLEGGEIDGTAVHQPQRADSGCGQIKGRRRSQPSGPDDQDPALTEADLSFAADVGNHDLAAVALDLLRCKTNTHGSVPSEILRPSKKVKKKPLPIDKKRFAPHLIFPRPRRGGN